MGVTGLVYNKDLVDKYAPGVLDDNVVTIDEIMEIIPKAKRYIIPCCIVFYP